MARSRARGIMAGAVALAVGGAFMLSMAPSRAVDPAPANGFTCRASTLRTEGSNVSTLNLEPFAANEEGGACKTESAGILAGGQGVTVAGLGTANVAYARTNATTNTAESGVTSANLTVASIPITATILASTASAGTCSSPALTGSSTVASVTVGATTVAIPTTADSTPEVTVPGVLSVYVNYQTNNGTTLTQRAVYVDVNQSNAILAAVPDVIIAEAIADIHGDPCVVTTTTTASTTTTSSSTTTTSTTSTTSTTTTTVPDEGRCPPPSPEGDPERDDSPIDKDCGYGQPSGVTKRPKN